MIEYIRTPDGFVYRKDECEFFSENYDIYSEEYQNKISDFLFEQSGILLSIDKNNEKGGE